MQPPGRAAEALPQRQDRLRPQHAEQDPSQVQEQDRQGLCLLRTGREGGDPLVDLFSADLAEAKGLYETKMAQWEHDRAELNRSAYLLENGADSEKVFLISMNDETKSGTEAKGAKYKLMVFGLPMPNRQRPQGGRHQEGQDDAPVTLLRRRHPPGRRPRGTLRRERRPPDDRALDHFWVYGYVYPSDAPRVSLGDLGHRLPVRRPAAPPADRVDHVRDRQGDQDDPDPSRDRQHRRQAQGRHARRRLDRDPPAGEAEAHGDPSPGDGLGRRRRLRLRPRSQGQTPQKAPCCSSVGGSASSTKVSTACTSPKAPGPARG